MNKYPFEFPVNQMPDRAGRSNGFPFDMGTLLPVAQERPYCRSETIEVADAEEETAEPLLPYRRVHRVCIVAAGPGETKAMMGMPFPDVMQSVALFKKSAYSDKVVNVLIEERGLVVRPWAGTYGIHNHRDTCCCPISE